MGPGYRLNQPVFATILPSMVLLLLLPAIIITTTFNLFLCKYYEPAKLARSLRNRLGLTVLETRDHSPQLLNGDLNP